MREGMGQTGQLVAATEEVWGLDRDVKFNML